MADINKTDIKLMEPQVLDDTSEGGGQMTGTEVVSGSVNNLFPDISRLDRTYGRVSLRKAYLSIRTEDRAVYYGAHSVITEQASDPLVSVTMFSTESWFDHREDAKDRMEAYLTKGPQYSARLYNKHYTGTRNISMVTETSSYPPEIGDVLVLLGNKDLQDEFEQYIRVLDVNSYVQEFIDDKGSYYKQVIEMEISASLEYDFEGNAVQRNTSYQTLDTYVYTVVVANAANYYGVTILAEDVNEDALALRVDEIFKPLVPASQSSIPITDAGIGSPRTRLAANANGSISVSRLFTITNNAAMLIGEAIIPGSLTFHNFYDDGEYGIRNSSGDIVAGIDYATGAIQCSATAGNSSGAATWTYIPALADTQISATGNIAIEEANRGFAYIFSCPTLPVPLSMRVAYMAGDKWYVLQDVGNGRLSSSPNIDSAGNPVDSIDLGTGLVNYVTGSVSLTLKYMPDVETNIMFSWADETDLFAVEEEGSTQTLKPRYDATITWQQPVPGSVVISQADIPDIEDTNGDGLLYQSATEVGTVDYQTGVMYFIPVYAPPGLANFSVGWNEDDSAGDADERENKTYNLNIPVRSGENLVFTIDGTGLPAGKEIVPGTFSLNIPSASMPVGVGELNARDAGDGILYRYDYVNKTTMTAGTINYETGAIVVNVKRTKLEVGIQGYQTSINSYITRTYGG